MKLMQETNAKVKCAPRASADGDVRVCFQWWWPHTELRGPCDILHSAFPVPPRSMQKHATNEKL